MPLYLHSEKVGPTGGVTSIGVKNQLGRPQLDPLTVLVREAVQNSWDARSNSTAPVDIGRPITFGAVGWTMTDPQHKALRNVIFADFPDKKHLGLGAVLQSPGPLHALVIYDRGTVGLGGPTRADDAAPGEVRDFVDFLRNVGQPPDKELTGGTYGYGKAAFYRVSHSNTICVHTRCKYKGHIQSRFICAALGSPYTSTIGSKPYTGRHWWGRDVGGIAEPLLDEDADKAAEMLGMPSYDGDDLGTTIMILQPFLEIADSQADEYRTPWQAMNILAESALFYFWPKMLQYDRGYPAIQFDISWNGTPVTMPAPEQYGMCQGL